MESTEENENYCTKSYPYSSGLKRMASDRSSSPIHSERDNLSSSVLFHTFSSKRTRISSDFQSSQFGNGLDKVHLKSGRNHEDDESNSGEIEVSQQKVEHCGYKGEFCELGQIIETDVTEMNNRGNEEISSDDKDIFSNNFLHREDGDEAENGDDSQENGGDEDSDCDKVSEISGLSDLSMESRWNSSAGMMVWVQQQISRGTDPRDVLRHLILDETEIPEDFDNNTLWQLILSIVSEPPRRRKLAHVTTLDYVVDLIRTSKKIIVLSGAGISVSCGIPDFRSYNGIYARLAIDYPDLPNPNAMFEIKYFKKNPKPFFKFAREIYPGLFVPSVSHRFIGHLESRNQLLRNYTQNIDTLESAAGITRVVQCHGSFATATCLICRYHVDAEFIREDIMNQVIPRCPQCSPDEELAILKPDIVFFGESLSDEFHRQIEFDKEECDLLIVIGSSLKVRPVSMIPSMIPAHVPQVLINRESLPSHNFDVELLGNSDIIVDQLCHLLGDSFKSLCTTKEPAIQLTREDLLASPACHSLTVGALEMTSPALENSELPQPEDIRSNDKEIIPEKKDGVDQTAVSEMSARSDEVDVDSSKEQQQPQSMKVASQLRDNTYVYLPPRRYVFVGAEVYEDEEEMTSDSLSSSSCSSEPDEAEDSVQVQEVDDLLAKINQNTEVDHNTEVNRSTQLDQPLQRLDSCVKKDGCSMDGVLEDGKVSGRVVEDRTL